MDEEQVDTLFARYVEHLVLHGAHLDVEELASGDSRVAAALRERIQAFQRIDEALERRSQPLTGRTLGRYQVLDKLGAGGMGEVYRARDQDLGREVALKVLPAVFALEPERRSRFEREARMLAALDHRNIASIYGLERVAGVQFLALELVPGETLQERIARGPLSLAEILAFCQQMALALAAAHAKGIVHRDLKPANVKITPDGTVKVLDFGLGKTLGAPQRMEAGEPEASNSEGTTTGLILGTAPYMSPEQARGERVDQRTDVFSFGVVLLEMLSGRNPFKRERSAETVAAILTESPPPLSASRPDIEAGTLSKLQRVIDKCLARDPATRYQTTKDLLLDLDGIRRDSESEVVVRTPATPGRRRWFRAAGLVGVLLGGAGAYWLWSRPEPVPVLSSPVQVVGRSVRDPVERDIIMVPLTSYPGTELDPAFSPDGRLLAFSWDGEEADNTDVYVQLIGAGVPLRLTTHLGADTGPAWSPDGRFIAFTRTDQGQSAIYLVPALGGPERKLLSLRVAGDWYGLSPKVDWSPDGKTLVFADQERTGESPGIVLLSLEDLERRRLTIAPPKAIGDWSPAFSPDGRQVAFVRWWGESTSDIHLAAVEGGEVRRLSFDELPLVSPAWTPDGRGLVYWATRGAHGTWWMPVSGGAPRRLAVTSEREPALFSSLLDISPDGRRLAVVHSRWDENIWRLATTSTTGPGHFARHKLIASTRAEAGPQFSPDGSRIAFESARSGAGEVWLCDGDGSNPRQLTFFGGPHTGTPRWSPDGRFVAFDARKRGGLADIYAIGADGGPPRQVTSDPSNDVVPSWSRDGRHIYFASNRSGRREVWRVPAEGGTALPVTKHGGFAAFESPDGRWVYYSKFDEPGIWRVPVGGSEETLVLDRLQTSYWGYWAVTAEGLYFLDTTGSGRPAIAFYGFATRRVSPIATLDRGVGNWIPGLTVSPDGRSILYVQPDERGSDILLAENWH